MITTKAAHTARTTREAILARVESFKVRGAFQGVIWPNGASAGFDIYTRAGRYLAFQGDSHVPVFDCEAENDLRAAIAKTTGSK